MARPRKKPKNLETYTTAIPGIAGKDASGVRADGLSPYRIQLAAVMSGKSDIELRFLEGWDDCKVPKASEYVIEYAFQGFNTLNDPGLKTLRMKAPFVAPAPEAKMVSYDLASEVPRIAMSLLNKIQLTPERMERLLKFSALYGHEDPRTFWREGEEDFIGVVLPHVQENGLLWLKLAEISHLGWKPGKKTLVPVKRNGEKFKSIEHWLGPYMRKEYANVAGGASNVPLSRLYRESAFDSYLEAVRFSHWARGIIRELDKKTPSAYEFPWIEEVLARSTPRLRWVNSRLQVYFQPDNVLDACYLWVLDRIIYGRGFRLCRNMFCEDVFELKNPKALYCREEHGNSYRAKIRRDGERTGAKVGRE